MISLTINNKKYTTELSPDTPLLWFLRDELSLIGTKFGCGKGLCGACTVHLNGNAIRSCSIPINAIGSAKITTIEGEDSSALVELRKIWENNNIPQCGYCQVGQLMSASALLTQNVSPSEEDINTAMAGNICRCGTYVRIKKGILEAASQLATEIK